MKKFILTLLLASSVTGLALAQPAPPEPQSPAPSQTPPPSDYPQSSTPQPSSSGTTSTTDKRALMKQCVAQQEQQVSSSGMSRKDIKEYCKKQVTAATQDSPPR